MKRGKINVFAVAGLFLMLVSLVSAYGLGGSYNTESPLRLYPGQKTTINLELQNLIQADGDLSFILGIPSNGEGIAKLVSSDPIYFVPNGERVKVPVEISVPTTSAIGKEYIIGVSAQQQASNNPDGMVNIVGQVTYTFKVLVVPENDNTFYQPPVVSQSVEEPRNNTWIYVVIVIAVILGITYLLSKKKK